MVSNTVLTIPNNESQDSFSQQMETKRSVELDKELTIELFKIS
jgi:hypothetical protein